MVVKLLAIAAVGGVAYVFMRPRVPILPHPTGWGADWEGRPGKSRRLSPTQESPEASDALQEVDDSEQCLAVPDKVPSLERLQEEDTKQAPAGSENRLTHVTENARLVHALLLQGDKDIIPEPGRQTSGIVAGPQGFESEVRSVMERAFWNALREGLEAQPWQWQRLAALIKEARGQLEGLTSQQSAHGRALLAEMQEKLAQDYIETRLAAGCDVQYLRQLFEFMVYVISKLEAPARRPQTQQAFEELSQAFAGQPAGQASSEPDVQLDIQVKQASEVPVSMQVKDSWLPVDLSQGGSAAPTPPTTPPPVQRITSPGIPDDWVLNMGSVSGPEWTSPGNRAGTPSPKPRVSPDLSIIGPSATRQFHFDESGRRCSSAGISHDQVQRTNWAQGDKWEQVQAAESPRSGDADDVVEVRLGPIMAEDGVSVTIRATQGSADKGLAAVIVQAVRFIMHKTRELRSDTAIAHLNMLRGLLQDTSSGIRYERQRFTDAVGEGSAREALPRTHSWLQESAGQGQQQQQQQGSLAHVLVAGLLRLMQRRTALSQAEAPETLVLDVPLLVGLQNQLQCSCLVAAALLIAQQLLAYLHLPSSPAHPDNAGFFQTVRDQFLALLSAPDVSLAGLVEAMTRLLTERCAASTAQPRRMDGDLVSRMLSRIFSHEDPVYQRVERGITEALSGRVLEMLGQQSASNCRACLQAIGVENLTQEVQSLAERLGALAVLNLAVCQPLYSSMLQDIQSSEGAAGSASSS